MRQVISIALAVAVGAVVAPSGVRAQAMLLDGLGGPADYGTGSLPGNDDGSSAAIDLGTAFPSGLNFFGTSQRTIFVNNNGNVTFGAAVFAYTPVPFPSATQPMIAPW